MAMMATLNDSPMPSHRMNSGINPSDGIDRWSWAVPSMSASPMRLSPAGMASTTAISSPKTKPQAARAHEVAMSPPRSPFSHSSHPVWTTGASAPSTGSQRASGSTSRESVRDRRHAPVRAAKK